VLIAVEHTELIAQLSHFLPVLPPRDAKSLQKVPKTQALTPKVKFVLIPPLRLRLRKINVVVWGGRGVGNPKKSQRKKEKEKGRR
jgi:hypothetical protein